MNSHHHTHELRWRRGTPFHRLDEVNNARVIYGDQSRWWPLRGPFLEARRKRTIRRMIARHDRASIKAGKKLAKKEKQTRMTLEERRHYNNLASQVAGQAWLTSSEEG